MDKLLRSISYEKSVLGIMSTYLALITVFVPGQEQEVTAQTNVFDVLSRIEAVLTVITENGSHSSYLVQGDFPNNQAIVGITIPPQKEDWFNKYPLSSGRKWLSRPQKIVGTGAIIKTGPQEYTDSKYDISSILKQVKQFPNLKAFDVSFCRFDDDDFQLVPDGVTSLMLSSTSITDEGLEQIGRFKKLRELELINTKITNKGIQNLAKLNQLKVIRLGGTQINDDASRTLVKLKQLEEIYVHDTCIGDNFIAEIMKLPNVKILDISNTKISNDGLSKFSNSCSLLELHVNENALDNSAISHFENCSLLKTISIVGTKISSSGTDQIQKKLRDLTIIK